MAEIQKSIHELEHQVRQIASSQYAIPTGTLLSDTQNSPKQVIIIILRNRRKLVEEAPK